MTARAVLDECGFHPVRAFGDPSERSSSVLTRSARQRRVADILSPMRADDAADGIRPHSTGRLRLQ